MVLITIVVEFACFFELIFMLVIALLIENFSRRRIGCFGKGA